MILYFQKVKLKLKLNSYSLPGQLEVYKSHPTKAIYDYIGKILKKRTTENETINSKYKYLFEKIKKKSKTSCYQRKLKLFEDDIKKQGKY